MTTVRYHGTNAYFLPIVDGLLAIDCGWPCSLPEYRRLMKEAGLRFQDIRRAIVTHLHMDHAGLLGEFQREGIPCYLIGEQTASAIDEMEQVIRKNREYAEYVPVEGAKFFYTSIDEFNKLTTTWGVDLTAVATPSHSRDSLSFIVGTDAIVGDLTPLNQLMPDDAARADWALLRSLGVERAYHSHAANPGLFD